MEHSEKNESGQSKSGPGVSFGTIKAQGYTSSHRPQLLILPSSTNEGLSIQIYEPKWASNSFKPSGTASRVLAGSTRTGFLYTLKTRVALGQECELTISRSHFKTGFFQNVFKGNMDQKAYEGPAS